MASTCLTSSKSINCACMLHHAHALHSPQPPGAKSTPAKCKYALTEDVGDDGQLQGRFDLAPAAKATHVLTDEGDEFELWCSGEPDHFVVKVVKETCPACGKETSDKSEDCLAGMGRGGGGRRRGAAQPLSGVVSLWPSALDDT